MTGRNPSELPLGCAIVWACTCGEGGVLDNREPVPLAAEDRLAHAVRPHLETPGTGPHVVSYGAITGAVALDPAPRQLVWQ